jgi:hypothetical protein
MIESVLLFRISSNPNVLAERGHYVRYNQEMVASYDLSVHSHNYSQFYFASLYLFRLTFGAHGGTLQRSSAGVF